MTVRNNLRVYGVEPHNKWGALVWGTDTWAQQDVQWRFDKHIAESLSLASTQQFKVRHLVSEAFSLDSTVSRRFPSRVSESLSLSSAITIVYRVNNGWYLKKGDTLNALEYPTDNFSEVAEPTTTWSEVSTPSTVWT